MQVTERYRFACSVESSGLRISESVSIEVEDSIGHQRQTSSQAQQNGSGLMNPQKRILIADDHELFRAGLSALLRSRWNVCGEAGDGIEAVEKVRDLNPDLVLLDLSMPTMGGTQAAKAIRTMAPDVKVVILSMHDSAAVRDWAGVVGAHGFISKHCSAKDLRRAVARLLNEAE